MKLKARSRASAMRWPGGGRATFVIAAGGDRSAARRRRMTASRSKCCSAVAARRSNSVVEIGMLAALAPGRDGARAKRARPRAAARRQPACRVPSIASATRARCRSLPTRLRITPATRTADRAMRSHAPARQPTAPAAPRRAPARPANRNARRGRRWRRGGRAAPAAPSNKPMTPSITSTSAPAAASAARRRGAPAASPSCRD